MTTASIPAPGGMPEPYAYRGWCPACTMEHDLKRSDAAVEAARRLMLLLKTDHRFEGPGKMLGVLVGVDGQGRSVELHAFSGMLSGRPTADGFVGPTRPGRPTQAAQSRTLATLTTLSNQIAAIDVAGAQRILLEARDEFDRQIGRLTTQRRRGKRERANQREALRGAPDQALRLADLERQSQHEGGRLRALRAKRRLVLTPLEACLNQRQSRRTKLRKTRRDVSRALQEAMHSSHGLLNFAGRYENLATFFIDSGGIPTGTGECCAPKLLQEAALRGIRPQGMAEFWWGQPSRATPRVHGEFYPACQEKCAPILGHLLCGQLRPRTLLPILYADQDLLAIDKPAGLLSVTGRDVDGADCAETRLELLHPEATFLRAPHRLDQATSGVLLVARSAEAFRELSASFAAGRVQKEYRARVARRVVAESGEIKLPLESDPLHRPRQRVDHRHGRRASTQFQVLRRGDGWSDLELRPRTGRTHQLRVHCAHPEGLDAPIVGDRLYGSGTPEQRMLLHAHRLVLPHPRTGQPLEVCAPLPSEFAAR